MSTLCTMASFKCDKLRNAKKRRTRIGDKGDENEREDPGSASNGSPVRFEQHSHRPCTTFGVSDIEFIILDQSEGALAHYAHIHDAISTNAHQILNNLTVTLRVVTQYLGLCKMLVTSHRLMKVHSIRHHPIIARLSPPLRWRLTSPNSLGWTSVLRETPPARATRANLFSIAYKSSIFGIERSFDARPIKHFMFEASCKIAHRSSRICHNDSRETQRLMLRKTTTVA